MRNGSVNCFVRWDSTGSTAAIRVNCLAGCVSVWASSAPLLSSQRCY